MRSNQNGYRVNRKLALAGGSALTIAVAILSAGAARAQAVTPGSPECPIDADTVTCTGDVQSGFRADRDPVLRHLVFKDLTLPIAPPTGSAAIDVRPNGDLTLDLDSSVTIDAKNAGSAIDLEFDPALTTIASVRTAADIRSTVTQNGGGIFVYDADDVHFQNSGTIRTINDSTLSGSFESLVHALRVNHADKIAFRNDGTMATEGPNAVTAFLEAREVDIINTGTITASNTIGGDRSNSFVMAGLVAARDGADAKITFRNEGTFRTIGGSAYDSTFYLYGTGNVQFSNTGLLDHAGVVIGGQARNATDTLRMSGVNDGTVDHTAVRLETGWWNQAFSIRGRTSTTPADGTLPPFAQYSDVSLDFVNHGPLKGSAVILYGQGTNTNVDLLNHGLISDSFDISSVQSISYFQGSESALEAVAEAPISGMSNAVLTNDGRIDIDELFFHGIMTSSATHHAKLVNSGRITATSGGDVTLIEAEQGTYWIQATFTTPAVAHYVFDGLLEFANSGEIDVTTRTYDVSLVGARSIANQTLRNDGSIHLTATPSGWSYYGYNVAAMLLDTYSNADFVNNGSITVTTPDDIREAGFGIFLLERSIEQGLANQLQSSGLLRGYDRDADLHSRLTLDLQAGDVTATGLGSYGIFGILGVTISDGTNGLAGRLPNVGAAISNDQASAVIRIAPTVSVTGGSGAGTAIGFEGAGTVTLNNAGMVVGRGNADSGAILLSSTAIMPDEYIGPPEGALPLLTPGLTLNLVDSVNSGAIVSEQGHAIRVANGAIRNFVNSGTIRGGAGAIEAVGTSDIANASTGVIEGLVSLRGAGSVLTNAGLVRLAGAGAQASVIAGDYLQTGGRLEIGLSDTVAVTGNLSLAGELGLTLGVPSGSAVATVGGNLTVDALLDVTDGGGFGSGVYRLFDYGGALSGSGLRTGLIPGSFSAQVQTGVAGQVNLLVGSGNLSWDGANTSGNGVIDGGSGTWDTGTTNWTVPDGSVNQGWGGGFAIFQGAPGTVTIAPGGLTASGLQFAVDGYRIEGQPLTLNGPATLRVGDGSAGGAGYVATIASAIGGSASIDKTDLGTLILSGANSFSGGMTISGGTLRISGDSALGTGGVAVNTGSLLIDSGAQNSTAARIAPDAGNFGDATIAGAGTRWSIAGDLGIGHGGPASFTVSNGAVVTANQASVGNDPRLDPDAPFATFPTGEGTALVTGTGSRLDIASALSVGDNGVGTLTIADGAAVTSGRGFIGRNVPFDPVAGANSFSRGEVTVAGAGSSWDIGLGSGSSSDAARLLIGDAGGTGILDILDGARITSGFIQIGNGSGGGGNGSPAIPASGQVTVSGAGSLLEALPGIQIGLSGGDNVLIVSDGGRVHAPLQFGIAPIQVNLPFRSLIAVGSGLNADGSLAAATAAGLLDSDTIVMHATREQQTLLFNHTATRATSFILASAISTPDGPEGNLIRQAAGVTVLTGDSSAYLGATAVEGGSLVVNGALGGTIDVRSGARLAGTGRLGATNVANGGVIEVGDGGIGTLTFASLALSQGSRLAFDLGMPDRIGGADNDLIRVTGGLTLDGLLDVTALPGFGQGVYRLIDYDGALSDNGLALGNVPGMVEVQTAVAGQVNLVVGSSMQFWDGTATLANGAIDGGSGPWNASSTNWTRLAGDANQVWGSGFAVFQGTSGTVTIAPGGVSASGLQFAVDGYRIEGGPLALTAPATLRVGDGSAAGAGYVAIIASTITGSGGVAKTDLGTLILSGANGYAGGTIVSGGVLQIGSDAALGEADGGLTLDGGALRLDGDLTTARAITVDAMGGTIDTGGNVAAFNGTLSGTGTLAKTGSGTLAFGGDGRAFSGLMRIDAGSLALAGSLGNALSIASGAGLTGTGKAGGLALSGTIAPGAGGTGTLTITGDALFAAGSSYQVDIAGDGASDRIQVGGVATLEGGSVVINQLDPSGSYVDGAVYRILDAAGGRTGSFAGVVRDQLLFGFTLGYDPTGAFVTASAISTSYNQGQAASGLNALRGAGTDGAEVFDALIALEADPLRSALDANSGEIYADLVADGLGGGLARAEQLIARAATAAPEGWGLWGGLDGRRGTIDGDGNAASIDHGSYGFDFGIDYRGAGNSWAIGAGGGYVHGSVTVDERASRSTSDGWQLGGFARYGSGGARLTASIAATYRSDDANVIRRIAFTGIDRTATGTARIKTAAVTGDLRYGLPVASGWTLGPVASLGYAHGTVGSIDEIGAESLALSGQGDGVDWTRYGGGAFANWQGEHGSINASAQYVSGSQPNTAVTLAFDGMPGAAFNVRAPRLDSDAVLLDFSARQDLGNRWSLSATTRATLSQDNRSVSGNIALSWHF